MSHPHIRLEQLIIREPCPADWEKMSPAEAGRFCSHCNKRVHDLTAMSRDAAERLVCESAGGLCIRMQYAADGTVVTHDYRQKDHARRGWGFWTGIGLIGAIATWVVGGVLGRGGINSGGRVAMGAMLCPPLATAPTSSAIVPTPPTALPPSLVVPVNDKAGSSRLAKDVPMELRVQFDPPTVAE